MDACVLQAGDLCKVRAAWIFLHIVGVPFENSKVEWVVDPHEPGGTFVVYLGWVNSPGDEEFKHRCIYKGRVYCFAPTELEYMEKVL